MSELGKDNQVRIIIPPETLAEILTGVQTIQSKLEPFLIELSPAQRQSVPKMNDKTYPFVAKCLDYAQTNPKFVPPYLDVAELQIDLNAVNDLTKIFRPLEQIYQNLDDSKMLSGSEAYVAALSFYNSVKQAAKMEVPGAKAIFDDLQTRWLKAKSSSATGSTDELKTGN